MSKKRIKAQTEKLKKRNENYKQGKSKYALKKQKKRSIK